MPTSTELGKLRIGPQDDATIAIREEPGGDCAQDYGISQPLPPENVPADC